MTNTTRNYISASAVAALSAVAFFVWWPQPASIGSTQANSDSLLAKAIAEASVVKDVPTIPNRSSEPPTIQKVPYERAVTLTFPSGRTVEVTLQRFEPEMPSFKPSAILSESYDRLASEALAGNIPSARYLGFRLRKCQNAFSNKEDLDRAVSTLEQDNLLTYPETANRSAEEVHEGLDQTRQVESLIRRFEVCQGISEEQRHSAIDWSYLAASQGDFFAARDIIETQGFTPDSFKIWEAAWSEGYSMALEEMVYYWINGIVPTQNEEAALFNSYAHLYAFSKLKEASFADPSQFNDAGGNSWADGLGAMLSAARQEEAQELAADIIESNENCCIMWSLAELP